MKIVFPRFVCESHKEEKKRPWFYKLSENEVTFVIDGIKIYFSSEVEQFNISEYDFFENLKNLHFKDNDGVSHNVNWIHPNIKEILEKHQGEERMEILYNRNIYDTGF